MIIIPFKQGTPEWLAVRDLHDCASDAPAMMGASKYQSRNDLLRRRAGGVHEEIDAHKQALFDRGHAAEEACRGLVEEIIGEELEPITASDDQGKLLASYDGVTMLFTAGYEHKLWNEELADDVRRKDLRPMYFWQLEQQIHVGGLEMVIFAVSDGTREKFVHMEYRPVPGRIEKLLDGWKQFHEDLKNYQHVEVLPPATATAVKDLPALSIQVNGSISLISNLELFGRELTAFIENIDENPSDDQAFANCEAAVKSLAKAENSLLAAEASALAQTATIDDMRRTVAAYHKQARDTRLTLEKLVKVRKESVRAENVIDRRNKFREYLAGLNTRIGSPYMPRIDDNFLGVIKGKRTIASLHDALDTELARLKIESSATADRIIINVKTLRELAADYKFLFDDTPHIVLKDYVDAVAIIKSRIAEYKDAEAKRLEAEREVIRREEEAKAKAKVEKEREEAERVEREKAKADKARQIPVGDVAKSREVAKPVPEPSGGGVSPTTKAGGGYQVIEEDFLPGTPSPFVKPKVTSVTARAVDVAYLRDLVQTIALDMSPGELQQAIDFMRDIKLARKTA